MTARIEEAQPGAVNRFEEPFHLTDINNSKIRGSDPCALLMPDGEQRLITTWGPTEPPDHQQGVYYQRNVSDGGKDFFGPFDPRKVVMIGGHQGPFEDTRGNEVFDYAAVPKADNDPWYIGMVTGFDKHWSRLDSRQWLIVCLMTELGWKKIDIAFDKDTIPVEGYSDIRQIKEPSFVWDPQRKVFVGVISVLGKRSHDGGIRTSPHFITGYLEGENLKWAVDRGPFMEPPGGEGRKADGWAAFDHGCLRLDNKDFNGDRLWHFFHVKEGPLPRKKNASYPDYRGMKVGIWVTSWFDSDWSTKVDKLLFEPEPNTLYDTHLGGPTFTQNAAGKWYGYLHGDNGGGSRRYLFGVRER